MNYDQAFKPKLDKPFERLTLGEVVKGLRMLDTTQTANAEPSNQRSSATGPIRRTVSKTLSKKLDGICVTWSPSYNSTDGRLRSLSELRG